MMIKYRKYISLYILMSIIVSLLLPVTSYASTNTIQKEQFSLSSTETEAQFIDLYLQGDTYLISIDDLCTLTRCIQKTDGDIITVTQGFWSARFDTKAKNFDDSYQHIDIPMIQISPNEYAIPALMFLSYFKAYAVISNGTLYCKMPICTPWEALDLNYADSLIDINELYGGEGNIKWSLVMDIIMEMLMGDIPEQNRYLISAYNEALNVNIYELDAVRLYANQTVKTVNDDINLDSTKKLLNALSSLSGDAENISDTYITFRVTGEERFLSDLAYNASQFGDDLSMSRYANQIASVWREGEYYKSAINNGLNYVNASLFLMTSAVEVMQQVQYANQENNLVYDVMGEKNMNKLWLDAKQNVWTQTANKFYGSSNTTISQSMKSITADLLMDNVKDLIIKGFNNLSNISEIQSLSWKIGLEGGRSAARLLSWIDSIASDTLLDYALTDIDAYEADRLAIYLSKLQENVYCVCSEEEQKILKNPENADAFRDYIRAEQLYCRVSIAMYSNLIHMVDEFGMNKNQWKKIFNDRINRLAITLYQLTMIQDNSDGCTPMNLSDYVSPTVDIKTENLNSTNQQISQIQVFEGSELMSQYDFVYRNTAMPVQIDCQFQSDTMRYDFDYDEAGRLLRIDIDTWGMPKATFSYNAQGLLTGWTEAEGGRLKFTCLYNDKNQLVEANGSGDSENYNLYYYYDEQNRLSKVVEEVVSDTGSAQWEYLYQYNESGQKSCVTLIQDGRREDTYYSYQHAPFTLTKTGYVSTLSLEDAMGHEIFSLYLANATIHTDSQNQITEAVDGNNRFVFKYSEDTTYDNSGDTTSNASNGIDWNKFFSEIEEGKNDLLYGNDSQDDTKPQRITEEEAYKIACEKWNYSEGAVDEDTGFQMFVVSDGIVSDSSGREYYSYRLQWWVENEISGGHMSTEDYLKIDSTTGKILDN